MKRIYRGGRGNFRNAHNDEIKWNIIEVAAII